MKTTHFWDTKPTLLHVPMGFGGEECGGDAAWQGFIMKVEYKAAAAGVHLVKLNQWFASSKTCHYCGHKMADMPLHKCIWQCPACNVEHDRDINAALNIQNKGITELMAAGLVVTAHRGQRKSAIQTVAA